MTGPKGVLHIRVLQTTRRPHAHSASPQNEGSQKEDSKRTAHLCMYLWERAQRINKKCCECKGLGKRTIGFRLTVKHIYLQRILNWNPFTFLSTECSNRYTVLQRNHLVAYSSSFHTRIYIRYNTGGCENRNDCIPLWWLPRSCSCSIQKLFSSARRADSAIGVKEYCSHTCFLVVFNDGLDRSCAKETSEQFYRMIL